MGTFLNEFSKDNWKDIENLVSDYQLIFKEGKTKENIKKSQIASNLLISSFMPLFEKYISIIKTGYFNWDDIDSKMFIYIFVDDISLQRALKRKKQKACYRTIILSKFNFIKETYGRLKKEEIMVDLQMLFLQMARRYKQVGKNFCAYIHNCFRYEVARHIKSFIKNPLNIDYKNDQDNLIIDTLESCEETSFYEDNYYEDVNGVPDLSWINGQTCSNAFNNLTNLEITIIIKYYLEEWNAEQIGDFLGYYKLTIHKKRKEAVKKIAQNLDIDEKFILKTRNSGLDVLLPLFNN